MSEEINVPEECPNCGETYIKKYKQQRFCQPSCAVEGNKPARDRFVILARDSFRCFYCGRTSYEHNIKLEVDHIIPWNKAGKSIASNLVTSCQQCNCSKSNKILICADDMLIEVARRNAIAGIRDRQKINDTPYHNK